MTIKGRRVFGDKAMPIQVSQETTMAARHCQREGWVKQHRTGVAAGHDSSCQIKLACTARIGTDESLDAGIKLWLQYVIAGLDRRHMGLSGQLNGEGVPSG
ncbi:hypothetical protein D3C86_1565570 [compost metagenome]